MTHAWSVKPGGDRQLAAGGRRPHRAISYGEIMSTEQRIREALQSVRDPATGLSIVATGQLTDIRVDDDGGSAALVVNLISPGYPPKDELDAAIRSALEALEVGEIRIEWGLDVPRKQPRQDLDRLPTVKNVIAVAAGKGGVGKSTCAVNIALALERLGAAVGILDADVYGPSIPKMLGQVGHRVGASADGNGIAPATHGGIQVMSVDYFVETGQSVMWRGPMIHGLLTQFAEQVAWGDLDYVIVDLPPGTGDAVLSLGQLIPITGALAVTTPQEISLLDVRKAVDTLVRMEVPLLGVVENMSYYRCSDCGHRESIFGEGGGQRLADEIKTGLLGQIPIDTRVQTSGEAGTPVVEADPDGEIAGVFLDIAARAALEAAKLSSKGPRRSPQLRTV
jgi:ATP-binding protein involved in chromosome partitioning